MSGQETKAYPDLANSENTPTYPPPPNYSSPGYPEPPQGGPPPGPPQYQTTVIQGGPSVIPAGGVAVYPTGTTMVTTGSTTTVIGGGGAFIVSSTVGPKPTSMTCRSCNVDIVTRIERKSTTKTHLIAACLCIIGCWPCVCIPYCTDSTRNIEHYCPNCNVFIGVYKN